MLLRRWVLAGVSSSVDLGPADGADDVRGLISRLLRRRSGVGSFSPFTYSPVDRLPPDLETLNRWIGRKDVGMTSLTLDSRLLLGRGTLGSIAAFSADTGASYEMLIFR